MKDLVERRLKRVAVSLFAAIVVVVALLTIGGVAYFYANLERYVSPNLIPAIIYLPNPHYAGTLGGAQ